MRINQHITRLMHQAITLMKLFFSQRKSLSLPQIRKKKQEKEQYVKRKKKYKLHLLGKLGYLKDSNTAAHSVDTGIS